MFKWFRRKKQYVEHPCMKKRWQPTTPQETMTWHEFITHNATVNRLFSCSDNVIQFPARQTA